MDLDHELFVLEDDGKGGVILTEVKDESITEEVVPDDKKPVERFGKSPENPERMKNRNGSLNYL